MLILETFAYSYSFMYGQLTVKATKQAVHMKGLEMERA